MYFFVYTIHTVTYERCIRVLDNVAQMIRKLELITA